MTAIPVHGDSRALRRRRGFTLIELLVALAVVSVVATVFVSFFHSSMDIARTARNRTVAAEIAEAKLGAILRHPERYVWLAPDSPTQEQFPVKTSPEQPRVGNPVEPPAALPVVDAARRRQETVYDNFKWQAFGRFPSPNAAYCEVTLVVHWVEAGRQRMLALTSALPRFKMPGKTEEEEAA